MEVGPVLAIDVGSRMGVTTARRGDAPPRSFAVELKRPGDPPAIAAGNLIAWMNRTLREEKPIMVVKEAPLHIKALGKMKTSFASARLTYELHGVIQGMCARFGIIPHEIQPNDVRKHFIGRVSAGSREETKRAVVARCQQLGYLPRDLYDEDRGDALAVWDYVMAHTGRSVTRELVLFQETA